MPPPPTPINGNQQMNQPTTDAHALHERQNLPVDPHLHGLRIALGSILSPVSVSLYAVHRRQLMPTLFRNDLVYLEAPAPDTTREVLRL